MGMRPMPKLARCLKCDTDLVDRPATPIIADVDGVATVLARRCPVCQTTWHVWDRTSSLRYLAERLTLVEPS